HDQFGAKARRKVFSRRFDNVRRRGRTRNGRRRHLELGRIDLFCWRRWRWRRGYLHDLRRRRLRFRLALPYERRWTKRRGGKLLVSIQHITNRRLPAGQNHVSGKEAEHDQNCTADELL